MRRRRPLRLFPDARVRLLHHHFAEIDPDEIVLENIVIEHVLGRFTEIDDPFGERRRLHAVGHVLRVDRTGRVVVTANAADAARDEMRITRIFVLHKDRIAAEDRRRAVTLDHLLRVEIDLGINAEAADDAGDRVPRHFNDVPSGSGGLGGWCS